MTTRELLTEVRKVRGAATMASCSRTDEDKELYTKMLSDLFIKHDTQILEILEDALDEKHTY